MINGGVYPLIKQTFSTSDFIMQANFFYNTISVNQLTLVKVSRYIYIMQIGNYNIWFICLLVKYLLPLVFIPYNCFWQDSYIESQIWIPVNFVTFTHMQIHFRK